MSASSRDLPTRRIARRFHIHKKLQLGMLKMKQNCLVINRFRPQATRYFWRQQKTSATSELCLLCCVRATGEKWKTTTSTCRLLHVPPVGRKMFVWPAFELRYAIRVRNMLELYPNTSNVYCPLISNWNWISSFVLSLVCKKWIEFQTG